MKKRGYYNFLLVVRMGWKPLNNIILLLLLIVVVLYCINKRGEGFQDTSTIELVVARYEEDLSWLKMFPGDFYSRLFIYNKGSDAEFNIDNSEVLNLENLGREGHTYLTHIVNNYDNLPNITFFLPGSSATNPDKMREVKKLTEYLKRDKTSVIVGQKDMQSLSHAKQFSLDEWKVTSPENARMNPESRIRLSDDRPLSGWFSKRFGGEELSCVSFRGIVAASRDDIRKRPKEFYELLLQDLLHPNPETGHYIERTWKHILSIDDERCISPVA